MLQSGETSFLSSATATSMSVAAASTSSELTRRRSTFYVPLISEPATAELAEPISVTVTTKHSLDKLYPSDLSTCSFDWSLDSGGGGGGIGNSGCGPDLLNCTNNDSIMTTSTSISKYQLNKVKRYGVVLNEVDLDINKCSQKDEDDEQQQPQQQQQSNTSTPLKLLKSKSRSNITTTLPDKITTTTTIASPIKEKSKTLPQNLSPANIFPPKHSFLLKSTPRISFSYLSDNNNSAATNNTNGSSSASPSPKKALSFIRRAHSTKLSRNNSLLKNLTSSSLSSSSASSKCTDGTTTAAAQTAATTTTTMTQQELRVPVHKLQLDQLEMYWKCENRDELFKDYFFKEKSTAALDSDQNDQDDAYSDTSYEKACRRGSAPATPILGQKQPETQTTSRFTNFFSKRSNPLKRTKSVTKLERSKRGPGGLRGSRSHESLLSSHALMSTIDLSCTGAVAVAPVHQSVLGRQHCFQVRGGPRGERYYSCSSRQERDLWIYSLRKSIAPNADHIRRTDNSLKMWIYEAKGIPPKKRYFCEINLDKTLYGRTSVKLRSELLFWGEYFDFPDIPDINVITVNVFRECEKKKKRDKHVLIGSVKIPIHEVTSKIFSEDWYQIISDKHDSISKNSSKEQIPTLRIKCRFQSIDILPFDVYAEFLQYLKENYKKVCEILEPVIGVKAKEDIGQALVLLMHAQGMAGAFLTDVVALDLLRVGDQRLTFRGNSLATKSMEAFLKLTGEQYLQDTLSGPISEVISSDRDCEVDPLKASGSLSRQQQSLRDAVRSAWNSIADSHKHFPPKLRECFATFRERLMMLDREDMADNLISASIFLRFLCPAILSPSLFNITNELPTDRATRNLTLVAKTLQTLANFTRFQGKENFMEFLNDFLEQEAPRMKNFLHDISSRTETAAPDTVLDWSGYIDQGKQLSILHNLLAESIQKLQSNRQYDLLPLQAILANISKAKESSGYINQQNPISAPIQNQENQPQNGVKHSDRGVIRGVLTPSSLEKNIFRYNDPTVSPLLKQNGNQSLNQSQNSINGSIYSNHLPHSHSTSSISLSSNSNAYQSHLIPTTVQQHHHHHQQQQAQQQQQHHHHHHHHQITSSSPPELTATLERATHIDQPRSYNTTSHYFSTGSGTGRRSPIRASTLPRNNNIIQCGTVDVHHEPPDTNSSSTSLIPIGMDTSNAFIRKSPTPHIKTTLNGSRNRNLNGSQLSLHSSESNNKNTLNLNLNLRLTQNAEINNQQMMNQNSNMPMNLEDLDDLLKYADEHANDDNHNNKPKGNLTAKGSNVSIGHCSSGYQSIATQSQSSSPVELGLPRCPSQSAQDYTNRNVKQIPLTNGKYQQHNIVVNKYNGNINNNNNIDSTHPPLAFKNPLYQMQSTQHQQHQQHQSNLHHHLFQHTNSQKSSSLTPSSSEERLSADNYSIVPASSTLIGTAGSLTKSKVKAAVAEKEHALVLMNNSRRLTSSNSSRLPRTNPLIHYKRDEHAADMSGQFLNTNNFHRYHRRLSLESARTLSDSSTDTEDGKRRRNQRSVEQCEREIQRLQTSLDSLRNQLGDTDLRGSTEDLVAHSVNSDMKMRSIISRLISMEEELRREQLKMSLALSHKQRVIEAQGQQIAALDAANNRLLSALSSLRHRYESNSTTPGVDSSAPSTPTTTTAAAAAAATTQNNGNASSLC